MKKTKKQHTPGQWYPVDNCILVKGKTGRLATVSVCKNYEDVTFKPIRDVEMEANAKLIASAPKLLKALEEMYRCFNPDSTAYNSERGKACKKALKAIKDATTPVQGPWSKKRIAEYKKNKS